jgi:hypothetical protein
MSEYINCPKVVERNVKVSVSTPSLISAQKKLLTKRIQTAFGIAVCVTPCTVKDRNPFLDEHVR